MAGIPFSLVDVFTRAPFAGNPLAVVHDASGLSDKTMQAIAREFGFSETTFVLPPEDPETTARVRIFTPSEEIPFAGHPNIGTAYVVAHAPTAAQRPVGDRLVFDERGGRVNATLLREAGAVVGAEITAPQPLEVLGPVAPSVVVDCLGLGDGRVRTDRVAPCVAGVGLPFAFAELESVEALAAATPDTGAFGRAAAVGPRTVDGFAICAFVPVAADGADLAVRSRVFSPLGHPPEDPATGSAAGALACLLRPEGAATVTVTQGVEMGRPGAIRVSVQRDAGGRVTPAIAGMCAAVGQGTLAA